MSVIFDPVGKEITVVFSPAGAPGPNLISPATATSGGTAGQIASTDGDSVVWIDPPSGLGAIVVQKPDGTSTTYTPSANTNFARGNLYRTVVTAAVSGDVVRVGPGVYNTGFAPITDVPAGVKIYGSGRAATTITTNALSSTAGHLGTGAGMSDLSIVTPNGDTLAQIDPATDVLVENCDLYTGFTGVFYAAGAAGDTELRGCRFYSLSDYFVGIRVFHAGYTLRLTNCLWLGTHPPDPDWGEVNVAAGTVEIVGGAIRSAADLHLSQSGDGVLRVSALDFDPAKVSGTITVVGGGDPTTDAADLTSGILDDERLSNNVPLKNTANTYVELNTFSNGVSSFTTGKTQAEQFGAGAAADSYGTAIGYGSKAGIVGTAIGNGAAAGSYGTAIGQGVTALDYGTAIGQNITGSGRVGVGVDLTGFAASVMVGGGFIATGYYQTAYGLNRGTLPAVNFCGWNGVAVDPSTGYQHRLFGYSSTAARDMAVTDCLWSVATDAVRTPRINHGCFDYSSAITYRTYLSGGSDGTQPLLSLFGGTPIAKPTVTGSRGGNTALASLLTQLAALGAITDSTS